MDRQEPELNALEARLADWRPSGPGLDRDRMLFLAGRASAQSEARGRLMAGVSAGLVVVSVALGGLLVRERSRSQALQLALEGVSRPVAPSSSPTILPGTTPSSPGSESYLVLTHRAIAAEEAENVVAHVPGPASTLPSGPTNSLRVRDQAMIEDL